MLREEKIKEEERLKEAELERLCKCGIISQNICRCPSPKYEVCRANNELWCIVCNNWYCQCLKYVENI